MPPKSYVIQVQVGDAWAVHHEGVRWMEELVALLGPCNPTQVRANSLEMGEVFASRAEGGGATRQFRLWCTDGPPQGALLRVTAEAIVGEAHRSSRRTKST